MMSCCLLKLQIRILPCFPWVLANFNSLISYCTEHVPNLISTPRSRIHVALLGSILPWCLDFLQVPEDAIPPETAEAPGSFPVASSFRPVKMCRSNDEPPCQGLLQDTTWYNYAPWILKHNKLELQMQNSFERLLQFAVVGAYSWNPVSQLRGHGKQKLL